MGASRNHVRYVIGRARVLPLVGPMAAATVPEFRCVELSSQRVALGLRHSAENPYHATVPRPYKLGNLIGR